MARLKAHHRSQVLGVRWAVQAVPIALLRQARERSIEPETKALLAQVMEAGDCAGLFVMLADHRMVVGSWSHARKRLWKFAMQCPSSCHIGLLVRIVG